MFMLKRMLGIRASNFKFYRLFSTIQTAHNHESINLSQLSQEISNKIIEKPKFEDFLLSQYPTSLLLNPTLINLILSSPSISENQQLSRRFLLFISDSTMHTTHLPKFPSQPASPNPCLVYWNDALSSCLKSKRTDLVSKLYHCMNLFGIACDETTAGFLVQAFCKEENYSDAYRTLKEFSRNGLVADVESISKLISCFANVGNFEKVSDLLHFMISTNRLPTVDTYKGIIHGLCENEKGDEAFGVFNELKLRGYDVDFVMYSTMIRALCRMQHMEEAKKLWMEMIEQGMDPDPSTYCFITHGYFKIKDVKNAMNFYRKMTVKGYHKRTVCYNLLINGLCLNNQVSEAIDIFNNMGRDGVEKNTNTYNTLIQGLCKHRRVDEATCYYSEMLKVGITPNAATYTPLIKELCHQSKMDEAIRIVKHMMDNEMEPSMMIHNNIIEQFCNIGKAQEGMAWLLSIWKQNFQLRRKTFDILANSLCMVGRVDSLLPVLDAMLKIGCSLRYSVCSFIVENLCGSDGKVRAIECLEEILLNQNS